MLMLRGSSYLIVKKNHNFILYIAWFFVTLLRKVFEKRAMTSYKDIMTILNENSSYSGLSLNAEKLTPSRGNKFSLTEAQKSNCVKSVLSTLMLLMLMVLGSASAWAQDDYSGIYFIANNNTNTFNPNDASTNWYMVPASNGGDGSVNPNAWQWNSDSNTPLITTYQTGKDYNSVWKIEKTGDYYHIIHLESGKYLTYNSPEYTKRRAFHLQAEDGGDNSLFTLTKRADGFFNINRKGLTSGNCWLNPANGNKPNYYALTNGSEQFCAGIVGVYSDSNDQGSKWYLEQAITFEIVNGNQVKINFPVPETIIRYTTDGSAPDGSSDVYSTPFTLTDGMTIKAIIGSNPSSIATFTPTVYPGTDHPYLLQNLDNTGFYMISGDYDNQYSRKRINTSSLARPHMRWYFEGVGTTNGVQYYYLKNKETGEYARWNNVNNANVILLSTEADFNDAADKSEYKFCIKYYTDATAPGYYIKPANATYEGGLSKNGGNNKKDNVNVQAATNKTARWNLIPVFDNRMPAPTAPFPFEVSDMASTTSYYKIGHGAAIPSQYFIIPSTNYATTSNAESDDNMAWFFVEAESDDWTTYYYIVNAVSGNYLYYRGDVKTSESQAFQTIPFSDSEKDRFQFAVPKTTDSGTNGKYYIVPKVLKELTHDQYTSIWRDNNNPLKTTTHRENNNPKWTFTSTSFKCEAPEIYYDEMQGKVELSSPNNAPIYYVLYTDETEAYPDLTNDAVKGTLTRYNGEPIDMFGYSYIKAIAGRDYTGGSDQSDVAVYEVTTPFRCVKPIINYDTATKYITIFSPTTDATVYYILGNEGDFSDTEGYGGTEYTDPIYLAEATSVRAIAISRHGWVTVSETALWDEAPHYIDRSSEITEMGLYYIANPGFTADLTMIGTEAAPFKGTFDGTMQGITLSGPLFGYTEDATIRNVIASSATVSGTDYVGAIVNVAKGETRIYNCGVLSGTVSGDKAGSLVGLLDDYSRVINCYSYATVSGGAWGAGIVGYNNYASTKDDIRTMVMNCMFYGEISSGTKKSPVYGGVKITNAGNLNGYNYYRFDSEYSKNNEITDYNCALAAEEKYLTRFEFFRHTLNSNRELAAWYALGDASRGKGEGVACEMAKWVLDTSIKYPILKPQGTYPSVINYTVAPELEMGTLSVSISQGSGAPLGASITTSSMSLPIYDKDPAHNHYNYYTVRLPYYNEVGTGNCTKQKVVTGWKITAITGGEQGHFVKNKIDYSGTTHEEDEYSPYNFADRNCTDKDLYSATDRTVGGRVFNQGAYFDVPEGVTAIEIEPYWGTAVYLSDPTHDVAYPKGYGQDNAVFVEAMGTKYDNASEASINDDTQTVYTTFADALAQIAPGSVYDNAIVLVGNYHHYWGQVSPCDDSSKSFTIMSADLNNDCEPDYSFIVQHGTNRQGICPIRFDFINSPGLGMVQKVETDKAVPKHGIWYPKGWFEVTNTTLIQFTQFEYESSTKAAKNANSPLILMGGLYDQFVTGKDGHAINTEYILMGGNLWMKEFCNGAHTANTTGATTRHIPISVSGGEFEKFYLTGTFRPSVNSMTDNAECYINGGKFGEVAGAGQEQLKGDVTWLIDHADIENFYGGGINGEKPVTGDIYVEINNSNVGTYCGGPKFGNMETGKTVKTKADHTKFGDFFGAGYGGTSYYKDMTKDKTGENAWNTWVNNDYGRNYAEGKGTATNYEYEYIPYSGGQSGQADYVGRFYVNYASLSLAETKSVESYLKGCNITGSFYGGGKLGRVDGTATSTLEDCTVVGNVFGAGFSGSVEKIMVFDKGAKMSPNPYYNEAVGVFTEGTLPTGVEYTWQHGDPATKAFDDTNHYIYTTEDLTTLGTVTGKVTLNIEGTTSVTGNVYGGGESSDATGDVEVNVKGGTMTGVYGGGYGQTTVVSGDVVVNIGTKTAGEPPVYGGSASVTGNVYGGSALGNTNAAKSDTYNPENPDPEDITASTGKTTQVNLYGGSVTGSIFGGGLGRRQVGESGAPGYVAPITSNVYGPVTVTTEGGMAGKVFGCNDQLGKPQGTVEVHINNTKAMESGYAIGDVYGGGNLADYTGDPIVTMSGGKVNNVYGGGFGASAVITGNTSVTISGGTVTNDVYGGGDAADVTKASTVSITGGTVTHDVYGGGALANTNTENWDDTKNEGAGYWADGKTAASNITTVSLTGGTIGTAYGGGLGDAEHPAYVYGNVDVTLNGSKVTGSIFGANNVNGTPKGHVKVWVKKTVNVDPEKDALKSNTSTAREARTTYDVTAVYGGGNQADYIPADATLDPAVEGNQAKIDAAFAEVLIEGCQQTSIDAVYGGGNAAAVPATQVTVKGTYIINTIYGGGNGSGDANPGANVGSYNNGATNYGTGKAVTRLLGGYINNVYGGSNTKGDIRGGTDVRTKQRTDVLDGDYCADLNIGKVYGAGSHADMEGDVTIVLECMPKDYVDQVFGGAEQAVVNGNVTLVVTSGKFGRIFGGNNAGGDIRGSVTVHVSEDGCQPLKIGELYGGGNQAPYSIYGCTQNGSTWTANEYTPSATLYFNEATEGRAAVQVNVYSCTSIGKIFGGGREAKVIGNTHVWVNTWKGYINGKKQTGIGKIGQVFGGGKQADVIGSTRVDIGTALANEGEDIGVRIESGDYLHSESDTTTPITAGIYGGGEAANVEGDAVLNIGTANQNMGVNIQGDIYGGGLGESTHVTGNVVVNIGKDVSGTPVGYANITGDVYGGSAKGKVNSHLVSSTETYTTGKTTQVNLYGGTISGNLYGGGLGEDNDGTENDHAADIYGPVTVNVKGGKVTNVFGCNNVLGSPLQTADVVINNTQAPTAPATYTITSVYGGGNQAAYTGTGGLTVTMNGGYVNDIFGGGLGTTATVNESTTVTLTNGSVTNDIYGGGSLGNVTGAVTVSLNGGTVAHDVYGGGALAQTNTAYGSAPADIHVTSVTLNGTVVTNNVYGGGLGAAEHAANVNGPVTVTVTNGKAANVFGCNNVNGAPQQTVNVTVSGTAEVESGNAIGNVYGGGNQAAYTGSPVVAVSGGTTGNVFGGGLGATAIVTGTPSVTISGSAIINNNVYGGGSLAMVTGDTQVTIAGGTTRNDVFGGGSQADVTGNVNVLVKGGTVVNDVYGGGALANTNTANWDASKLTRTYEKISGTLTVGTSVVTGLYKKLDEDNYQLVETPNAKAEAEAEYYRLFETAWAEGKNSASNTTLVTLTGGVIGNVYGGGLGNSTTAVYVYGDVTVNVNKPADITAHGGSGVSFTRDLERNVVVNGKNYSTIPVTGSIFGANNFNGSPKGNVTVEIWATRRIDGGDHVVGDYEVQGVYGGGNMANYLPALSMESKVIIHGCDATSIEKVYGGGNSASVPSTDVTIEGAFDIGYAFGGGNGSMPIKNSAGTWVANDGAMVTGNSRILAKGGRIGQVFGGSDAKGDILGSPYIDTNGENGECDLILTRIFGAGNEADVAGDVNIILSGCGTADAVQFVHGGSYNAHISGDVNLTITSGIYTNVFGGNDARGSIGGNINVNIEETDACKPIIIHNLMGGGNEAAYPGTKKDGTEYADPGNITVNIKSATRIDNVYGGGLKADVKGNTTVNINMLQGTMVKNSFTKPASYTGDPIPNIHNNIIDEAIGTIGNVYGGGNEGNVIGSSYVNIGTATTVGILKRDKLGGAFVNAKGDSVYNYKKELMYDIVDGNKVYRSVVYEDKPVVGVHITGNVFGGGNAAYVNKNTYVNIGTADIKTPAGVAYEGIKVEGSVYGGGNMGSVGTYDNINTAMPTTCTVGTGTATVIVTGDAEIGPDNMTMPQDIGHVFGASKGSNDISKDADLPYKTYVNNTKVTISGHAFVKGSVYGGSENGHVLHDTYVYIQGDCQIGNGYVQMNDNGEYLGTKGGVNRPYTAEEWAAGHIITTGETDLTTLVDGNYTSSLPECASWPYQSPYAPYDKYNYNGGSASATDGHTFYGNVYGGGSGLDPYASGKWLQTAGKVYGDTHVIVTGGHILTSIYGGNEHTDVAGDAYVVMTGGTLGVPRTLGQIAHHPVTCYLFGAGKGDTRTDFNTWTNVEKAYVHVSDDARIYGSVFGGGEDGHVLSDVALTIGSSTLPTGVASDPVLSALSLSGSKVVSEKTYPYIGTTGTSYVDGNIFGAGRGFTGNALTAGSIGGNADIDIYGGTILGSVYGGGRLASVGVNFVALNNPVYGQFTPDGGGKTYGHVTVDISGGIIGNDDETILVAHTKGGNVYGGGMGRLELLDGTVNPLWPRMAQVKTSAVNITGGTIKGSVYGGGELGTIYNNTSVTVNGGTVYRDVYGGGYGSTIKDGYNATIQAGEVSFVFTPMQFAGIVGGNTNVSIENGWVKKNVYGGGELASVGILDFAKTELTKHTDAASSFALSWPYDYKYVEDITGGTANVSVTGGRIGITGKDFMGPFNADGNPLDITTAPPYAVLTPGVAANDSIIKAARLDNGDVYGGSKGVAGDRYDYAYCANVKNTNVTVNITGDATPSNYKDKTGTKISNYVYSKACITGSVYGGGENGHVTGNTEVTLANGLIGHAIYGGGKGKDTYSKSLKEIGSNENYDAQIYSLTAGKVFGNTSVTMNGGIVVRNIYGGGNMASVGKGNYAGGTDDYINDCDAGVTYGYGEKINGPLWTNTDFLNSGKTEVVINAGTVGTPGGEKDDLPYGNVYGGCRGEAAPNIFENPRYEYCPSFFTGYVNETSVTIGDGSRSPNILGSVYGGGQDGHVRRDAHVIIKSGVIGLEHNSANIAAVGTKDEDKNDVNMNHFKWLHRGNVYGAGSGIGKYAYDLNYDGDTNDTDGTYLGNPFKETDYSNSAGSVTRFCTVEIQGGTIHRNVYGGGSLANAGAPNLGQGYDPYRRGDAADGHGPGRQALNRVSISGGTIGTDADNRAGYGGNVFGACRGENMGDGYNLSEYATSVWTEVNISGTADIAGNVYGGGELGIVRRSTEVNLTGGSIEHDAYGGGKGIKTNVGGVAADVGGDATVLLNQGVEVTARGCVVNRIFGCNDQHGSPKGHALVHVYKTQHKNRPYINTKYAKFGKLGKETVYKHNDAARMAELDDLATTVGMTSDAKTAYKDAISAATDDDKEAKVADYIDAIGKLKYDVEYVYGGGDLAAYEPENAEEKTEVIIDGCDYTSIKTVYGGGNAAPTAANSVEVFGTYEIGELFGGGNGKDSYVLDYDGKYYKNPGADVGYRGLTYYDTGGSHGKGKEDDEYIAIERTPAGEAGKTARQSYQYGMGSATTNIYGGRIHIAYGGSNTKGNIRSVALSKYENASDCDMEVDETYGGGKDAPIDGEVTMIMDCVENIKNIYGGSTNADVYNDIILNITNGTFEKVFGGNNTNGAIFGSITVNIQEHGCQPIKIGQLYAGGYLAPYSVYGYDRNPDGTYKHDAKGKLIPLTSGTAKLDPRINIISATRIDSIFGGGYQATVVGNPHINVNMQEGQVEVTDNGGGTYKDKADHSYDAVVVTPETTGTRTKFYAPLPLGYIGNIWGGGNEADIIGDTYLEIGTAKWVKRTKVGTTMTETPENSLARNAAVIKGEVFGGGNNGDVSGNTNVEMANGYVYNRIYGGGKVGNVGSIESRTTPEGHSHAVDCIRKPDSIKTGTGKCTVSVSGGRVGPFEHNEGTGAVTPTAMTMPQDFGYVFGAGQGILRDPATDPDIDFRTYVDNTEVNISGTALIAGGVYGGSENGRVLNDTYVYIKGGQIGIGKGRTEAYAEDKFIDPTTTLVTESNALDECDAWPYGKQEEDENKYQPYDIHAGEEGYTNGGLNPKGDDGHTFYGNVFGGGSGYFAYAKAGGGYAWLSSAGLVEGNTHVSISGGHILTNVYGGNEMSDVTGTCYVTMTDGTIGVPRTLSQIAAHPVTCYLFGAGKGDTRVIFNKSTNVGHTNIKISGGRIYGSVFGGGEDGHVMGNVSMNIQPGAKIGTWGTSYVEGNVFGGGRGLIGDAYTAGNVAGSITLNISGGEMLGSVYGGGRLGSVGYGLYEITETTANTGHRMYGEMQDDGYGDWYKNGSGEYVRDAMPEFKRGHIEVNISGGTIGNKHEFKYIAPDVTGDDLTAATTYMPNTILESNNRLSHTTGGNVFAGAMGRRLKLGSTTEAISYTGINWWQLGNVKSTKLTISGDDTWIMGNVYGGGEFGAVTGNHEAGEGTTKPGTEIIINGGFIGTEITAGAEPVRPTPAVPAVATPNTVKYTFGSVYGGGFGTLVEHESVTAESDAYKFGAMISDSTSITMNAGRVRASVYGGGELAAVRGSSYVTINGGEVGRNEVQPLGSANPGYVMFGGASMGNVYGGGKGQNENTLLGVVMGNTNVTIQNTYDGSGNLTASPKIYHNVYGGGALGCVGTYIFSNGVGGTPATNFMKNIPKGIPLNWEANTGVATVNILGGTIGISGRDNGMVNGSARGDIAKPEPTTMAAIPGGMVDKDPYDKMAWVERAVVNIGADDGKPGPVIKGSVYGGGENGHVFTHATVNVKSGTVGILEGEDWYSYGNDNIDKAAWITRGNIYGAGCGTDLYDSDDDGVKDANNVWAGCVIGNTDVNISGGHITQNVYGGGSMGSVGRILETETEAHTDVNTGFALSWPVKYVYQPLTVEDPVEHTHSTGKATVNITGGRIGTTGADNGDVFGGTRGEAGEGSKMAQFANVRETEVNISYSAEKTPDKGKIYLTEETAGKYSLRLDKSAVNGIAGSVYGGSENGHVNENTKVNITGGFIGHAVYGGGKGKGTYISAGKKVYSITAGKVYGNTNVTMSGGRVTRNIYGGGNLGSVGKGNYAFGSNDYSPHNAYGETLPEGSKLWPEGENAGNADFMNSGITTVNVTGGIVGFMPDDDTRILPMAGSETTFGSTSGDAELRRSIMTACAKDDLPTGNIFGGCRGEAAAESDLNNIRLGYVNESAVTIGDASTGPRIYGSVYGGGQDGHTRRGADVNIIKGEIGIPYNDDYRAVMGTAGLSMEGELDNLQWLHRGNVYGGGSGIGMYEDGSGNEHNSSSAGSVNGIATVTVSKNIDGTAGTEAAPGNAIYRNVYGGGSLASVCPFDGGVNAPYPFDVATPRGKKFYNDVTIFGTVGAASDYNEVYGGEVYGGSRGEKSVISDRPQWFSIAVWTRVKIMKGAHIMNNVFGGSDSGVVKKDSEVIVGEVE